MLERLSAVVLYVKDLKVALAFYHDRLGLPVRTQEPGFVEFTGPGNGIALREDPDRPEPTEPPPMQLVFSVRQIEASVNAYANRGVRFLGPVRAFPSGKLAAAVDPDGNILLFEERTEDS